MFFQCTELVTAFGQQIIDALVAYLKNPAKLCTTLGICSSAEKRSTSPYVIKTLVTIQTLDSMLSTIQSVIKELLQFSQKIITRD